MKHFTKILAVTAFLSFAVAFSAYAEERTPMPVNPFLVPENTPKAPAVPPTPVKKTTLDNLQAAFEGETNAHTRYFVFAQKADLEGYGKVASLFRAAARAEQVHFERHSKVIKALGGVPTAKIEAVIVKSTAENLKAAMEGEIYESTVMYPEFLAQAEKENKADASDSFEDAEKAETVHAGFYKEALRDLKSWKGPAKKFYVCSFCGNVTDQLGFKNCPICGESKKKFLDVK